MTGYFIKNHIGDGRKGNTLPLMYAAYATINYMLISTVKILVYFIIYI